MTTFTIVLCTEPYKYEATDTVLQLAEAILRKGHKIRGIFLFGSGVYNIKKDIDTGKTVRDLPARLDQFCQANGIEVIGCSTWVAAAGIKTEAMIASGKEGGLGELSNWVAESDKLLVFGTGG